MLVAKAIQDWLLYSGQEASTRYIDFSKQRFVDPVGSEESKRILEEWRTFYLASQEPVREHLRKQFPRNEGEDEVVYEKAIKARSFDILRGFLPAGASTNLAWHTNLRQAADHLMLLRHHPLAEVRMVAEAIEEALKEAHPSSFVHKRHGETESYNSFWMNNLYYFLGDPGDESPLVANTADSFFMAYNSINSHSLAEYELMMRNRPPKTELPKQIAEAGMMQFEFLIDFGSFRDIQRQRSIIQRMPLVTARFGMHPWYLESLPSLERIDAAFLIQAQIDEIAQLEASAEVRQYYYPMGMCVPCRVTGDLAALVYVVELRAQKVVHPTLHEVALKIADHLLICFKNLGLKLYIDREQGRFDVKRGLHDIVQK